MEHLEFFTPPCNQGQTVEVSYAVDWELGMLWRKTEDFSTQTTRYEFTEAPPMMEWRPWQEDPMRDEDPEWRTEA